MHWIGHRGSRTRFTLHSPPAVMLIAGWLLVGAVADLHGRPETDATADYP
jgi:hypothetical protein